ncbi:phosphate acyltransferase PlsX [Mycoplasmopsis felis]|uniref:phosphate acyltransferase PlsX n=1 Tax=Mycoplasmopsis felis TaxID=33923 RepID=UPI002AFE0237|nr:phosphate acyltransferase PlsX [Mycoplasmopsis felis]WQQ09460.1 phosphate acyltransferase PlsX [Mycoplasmopsis felis]
MQKTIVFDANGLDLGVDVVLKGTLDFVLNKKDVNVVLIGDFKNKNTSNIPSNIKMIQNDLKPSNPRNIRETLKENISINQAIEYLKENNAHGIISGGDSGTYISSLTFKTKRIENISRPAFMPIVNCLNGSKMILLDVGANIEVKPEYLVEWARLGDIFHKTIFNTKEPKISLLNIGTEEYKGSEIVRQASELLKNTNLNYIGFSETRNLLEGNIDVAVIDGYGGNLVIKSYEGAIVSFKNELKREIKNSFLSKIGALFLKKSFKKISKKLDFRTVANAWVIGVNALALKIHGSADEIAIYNALIQMSDAIDKDLLNKLKGAINES